MVESYDEHEGQEDGEYHFSDDQANYDMEADASTRDSVAVATAPKESISEKLKNHRRMVIGIIVFIVLLGIVYKLVAPTSSTPPVTDFQQGMPVTAPVKKVATPPVSQPPVAQTAPVQQTTATTVATQPVMPTTPVVSQSSMMPQQPAAVQQSQQVQPAQQSTAVTTTTTVVPADKSASVSDRLATLEQQNAALMNMMQTQFAQKIADADAQNTQLRSEVQELTGRVSNMEVAFRQLTKMLRNSASAATPNQGVMSAPPATRVSQPRTTYTVQAIIPGRAWLKSDSGDTVTVAEGDVLKGYGRIAKIDPYDGIVDIDTGNRMISLSYGASGD